MISFGKTVNAMREALLRAGWRFDDTRKPPHQWWVASTPSAFYRLQDAYDVMLALKKGKKK